MKSEIVKITVQKMVDVEEKVVILELNAEELDALRWVLCIGCDAIDMPDSKFTARGYKQYSKLMSEKLFKFDGTGIPIRIK